MTVVLEGTIFEESGLGHLDVTKLLNWAAEGRHHVLIDPPDAINDWLSQQSPPLRQEWRDGLQRSIRATSEELSNNFELIVSPAVEPDGAGEPGRLRCSLTLAVRILKEPLGILLENSENDLNFVMGIMPRGMRKRFSDAKAAGWLEPRHGGGITTLKSQLEARLGHVWTKIRTFVVFDSDCIHRGELEQDWNRKPYGRTGPVVKLEQLCREEIPRQYWRLERRFIESYMPISELVRRSGDNTAKLNKVQAFASLPVEARWYFHMKEGLQTDKAYIDYWSQNNSVSALDPLDLSNPLWQGFGQDLARWYLQSVGGDFDWDPEARAEADRMLPLLFRLL